MIFNPWRKYPRWKPKESGRYQCIVRYGFSGAVESYTILDLYYRDRRNEWVDTRRQSVFDGYKVYHACRAPIEDNRIMEDSLSTRIDVVAWRKMPVVGKWLSWRFLRKKGYGLYEDDI